MSLATREHTWLMHLHTPSYFCFAALENSWKICPFNSGYQEDVLRCPALIRYKFNRFLSVGNPKFLKGKKGNSKRRLFTYHINSYTTLGMLVQHHGWKHSNTQNANNFGFKIWLMNSELEGSTILKSKFVTCYDPEFIHSTVHQLLQSSYCGVQSRC
jgi:hypothetical protein